MSNVKGDAMNEAKRIECAFPPPCSAFALSEFTVTQRCRAENAMHIARKHEQRVWGSGGDHEKARAEVKRLKSILESWPNDKS